MLIQAREATQMTLGEYVRYRRGILGLSQPELAARMTTKPQSWLSQLERDKLKHLPDAEVLHDLAAALECDVRDLLKAAGYLESSREDDAESAAYIDWDDPTMQLWTATGQRLTPAQRRRIARILAEEEGD